LGGKGASYQRTTRGDRVILGAEKKKQSVKDGLLIGPSDQGGKIQFSLKVKERREYRGGRKSKGNGEHARTVLNGRKRLPRNLGSSGRGEKMAIGRKISKKEEETFSGREG